MRFSQVRDLLAKLHAEVGGDALVSFCWDGNTMRAVVARPESGKPLLVSTFDGPSDYVDDADEIIVIIARAANEHFV